jgi:hypothetical protein
VATAIDEATGTTHWQIRRYSAEQTLFAASVLGREPTEQDFQALGIDPYDESEVDGNLITTAGWGRLTALANAAGGNAVTSTTARVGAGNGGGTAAAGDTDLSASAGSANRWFQTCTVSNPTSTTLQFVASFGSADGNFAWNEFGIDIGTATVTSGNTVNAVLLNHKTSIAQGTKASGQTWTATATLTFT